MYFCLFQIMTEVLLLSWQLTSQMHLVFSPFTIPWTLLASFVFMMSSPFSLPFRFRSLGFVLPCCLCFSPSCQILLCTPVSSSLLNWKLGLCSCSGNPYTTWSSYVKLLEDQMVSPVSQYLPTGSSSALSVPPLSPQWGGGPGPCLTHTLHTSR